MAIKNIPQIQAPSYGGFVFALDFSMGFADSPTKLTYRVVSSSGTYINPTIGSSSSVVFGDFSFSGRVFSYEIEETVSSGKVLSVTLIDNSTILDKLYVVVFRPGLFGKMGSSSNVSLPVYFDADEKTYYDLEDSGNGFRLVKKTLQDGSVQRTVRTYCGKIGDIIMVGSEEPPDTKCEVASTSYTFSQLKSAVSVPGFSTCPINNDEVKKTYEGTLRSVLISWCQDFGYSFYWDYKNNKLVFFSLNKSVFTIPSSVVDKNIISKKSLTSAEGKYNQIAANYFIKPYTPKSTNLSKSASKWYGISLSAIPWHYFINKDLTGGTTKYGSGRSSNEFIESAVCGYLSPALRTLYNFSIKKKWGSACGMVASNYKAIDAGLAASSLTVGSYAEKMNNLAEFAGCEVKDLGGYYDCILVNYDAGIEESWSTVEQDIFTSKIGAFYYGPGVRSSESVFCSASSIVSMSVSVDPEGTNYEDADAKTDASVIGRKIFQRGGAGPNIPSVAALEQLGIDAGAEYVSYLLPVRHDMSGASSVAETLLSYAVISKANASAYNTLMFIAKKSLVDSYFSTLSSTYTTGSNEREQTAYEIAAAQKSQDQCKLTDINEKKCLSAKQEIQQAQQGQDPEADNSSGVSGLVGKTGVGANVSANGASVKIISSSMQNYRGVVTVSYSTEVLIDETQNESIVFSLDGVTSTSDDLSQTRLIIENRSISDNLVKDKPTPADLFSRVGYTQSELLKTVTYTCSDFVSSLPIGQDSGITNLDLTISDSGFSATYSYSTRPPVFGDQDLQRTNIGSNPSNPAIQIR